MVDATPHVVPGLPHTRTQQTRTQGRVSFSFRRQSRSRLDRRAVLDTAASSLDVLGDLAQLSPIPLGPLVPLVRGIVDSAEVREAWVWALQGPVIVDRRALRQLALQNEDDCVRLAERAVELLSALINRTAGQRLEIHAQLQHDVESLFRNLQDISAWIESQRGRSFGRRFLSSKTDKRQIADFHSRLDSAMAVFGVKAHIAVQQKLEAIRIMIQNSDSTTSARTSGPTSRRLTPSIPPAPSIFFGRDDLRDRLIQILVGEEAARVAILGPGGIGKTSLALIAMHSNPVEEAFGIRRLFFRCDAAPTPQGLISAIASDLGMSGNDLLSQIVAYFSASEQPTLVVLDNFETCWEPYDSRMQVEHILNQLTAISSLTLVVTLRGSERPLGPMWTRPFLPPLKPLDHIAARLTFITISDASHDDPSVGQLLHRLDNLPLAIALMANLAQFESPANLLERWETERTSMLHRGAGDRLSNLEISVKTSLESPRMANDPDARELLSLLACLPDGVPELKQLSDIAPSIPQPMRAAATLKQVSLAYSEEDRHLAVLAPIRAYIYEHHPPKRENLLAMRRYYDSLANVASGIEGGENSRATLELLIPEIGNLQAIIDDGLDHETDEQELIKLIQAAVNLTDLFRYTGLGSESSLVKAALVAPRIPGTGAVLEAECIRQHGELLYSRSQREEATARFHKSLELFQNAQQLSGQGRCTMMLGMLGSQAGDYKTSSDHIEAALQLYRAAQDSLGEADCLLRLAQASAWKQDYADAERMVRQALDAFVYHRHLRGRARCEWLIGFVLFDSRADYAEARRYLLAASEKYHALDDPTGEANALRILGRLALSQHDAADAEDALGRAHVMYTKVKWRYGQADCLQARGELRAQQGRHDDAQTAFEESRGLYRELEHQGGQIFCARALGDVELARGNTAGAAELYDAARALSTSPLDLARVDCCDGRLLLAKGNAEDAQVFFERSLERLQGAAHAELEEGRCREGLGEVLNLSGQVSEAIDQFQQARGCYRVAKDTFGEASVSRKLAAAIVNQGSVEEARVLLEEARRLYGLINDQEGEKLCDSIGRLTGITT